MFVKVTWGRTRAAHRRGGAIDGGHRVMSNACDKRLNDWIQNHAVPDDSEQESDGEVGYESEDDDAEGS